MWEKIEKKIKSGENGDRNESRTIKTKKEGRKKVISKGT